MAKNSKNPKTEEVSICRRRGERRDDRDGVENAKTKFETAVSGPVPRESRKVARRRQIDPTTCERDYTNDEIEFMQAMDAYKRSSGRMFPTCSEILEVVRGMGYIRPGLDVSSIEIVTSDDTNFEAKRIAADGEFASTLDDRSW